MSKIIKTAIATSLAPPAIGPYSQAIKVGNTVYVSGQIGVNPQTSKMVEGGVENETKQVLKNMDQILKAAGLTNKNVVKCTLLLANMEDFQLVNQIYKEYFKEPYPARAAYQVSKLPMNAQVEIEAIAVDGISEPSNL